MSGQPQSSCPDGRAPQQRLLVGCSDNLRDKNNIPEKGPATEWENTPEFRPIRKIDFYNRNLEKAELEARVLKHLRNFDKVNLREFTFAKTFDDLGLDSLDRINLITSVEEEFKTLFTDNQFDNFENLQEIIDVIAKDKAAI